MSSFIKEMFTIRYTNGWDLVKLVGLVFSSIIALFILVGTLLWISPVLLLTAPFILWVVASAIEKNNNENL